MIRGVGPHTIGVKKKVLKPTESPLMPYSHTVRGVKHTFADLRSLLARASPMRSGDQLAGIAAEDAEERVIAQMTLAELPLSTFQEEAVVPYESDAVTRLIFDAQDKAAFAPVAGLTVGEFRDWLLSDKCTGERITELAAGLMQGKARREVAPGHLWYLPYSRRRF